MRNLCVIILFLCLVSSARAEDKTPVYPDPQVFALNSLSSADIADVASSNYSPDQTICVNRRQNVTLSPLFSNAAATARIGIVKGFINESGEFVAKAHSSTTYAASSTFTIGGRYVSEDGAYDTAGYTHVRIVLETISAGSVRINGSVH